MSLIFIVLTIIGTLIVCLPEKIDKNDLRRYSSILLAIGGALCIAASDTFSKNVITKISIGSFLVWVAISQFVISFFFLKEMGESLDQFGRIFKKLKEYQWSLFGAFGASAGTMCFFLSYNYTLASIASPINATYPVLTIILSLFFLKEKISLKNAFGLVLVVISVIGIGFYGG